MIIVVTVMLFIRSSLPATSRDVKLRKVESMKRGKNGAIDGRAGVGRSSH